VKNYNDLSYFGELLQDNENLLDDDSLKNKGESIKSNDSIDYISSG
jgi:hypothetical protein